MAEDLICWYEGQEYSAGSVIELEGIQYECMSDADQAYWSARDTRQQKDALGYYELPAQAEARKQKVFCYYQGKKYSPGAPIKMPDGKIYRCQFDGKWHKK
jgi:Protein of unknown function (DUF1496)